MSDTISVGDILEWADNMGSPHRWRVLGIHLGGNGVEGVVELESVTHGPGWTEEGGLAFEMLVPEVLVRDLRKVPQ